MNKFELAIVFQKNQYEFLKPTKEKSFFYDDTLYANELSFHKNIFSSYDCFWGANPHVHPELHLENDEYCASNSKYHISSHKKHIYIGNALFIVPTFKANRILVSCNSEWGTMEFVGDYICQIDNTLCLVNPIGYQEDEAYFIFDNQLEHQCYGKYLRLKDLDIISISCTRNRDFSDSKSLKEWVVTIDRDKRSMMFTYEYEEEDYFIELNGVKFFSSLKDLDVFYFFAKKNHKEYDLNWKSYTKDGNHIGSFAIVKNNGNEISLGELSYIFGFDIFVNLKVLKSDYNKKVEAREYYEDKREYLDDAYEGYSPEFLGLD